VLGRRSAWWGAGYAARGLGLVSGAASIVTAPTASSLAWLRARAGDMPGLAFTRQPSTADHPSTPPESPRGPAAPAAGVRSSEIVNIGAEVATAERQEVAVGQGSGRSVIEAQSGSSSAAGRSGKRQVGEEDGVMGQAEGNEEEHGRNVSADAGLLFQRFLR